MESQDVLKNPADGQVLNITEGHAAKDKSENLTALKEHEDHDDLSGQDAPVEHENWSGQDAPVEHENWSGQDAPVEHENWNGQDTPVEHESFSCQDTPDHHESLSGQGAAEEAFTRNKQGQSNSLLDVDLHEQNKEEQTDLLTETVRTALPTVTTGADFEGNPVTRTESGCNRLSTEGELPFEIQTPAVDNTVLEENDTAKSLQEMPDARDTKLKDFNNPDQSFQDKYNVSSLNLLENESKNETSEVRSSADSTAKGSESSDQGVNADDTSLGVLPTSPDPVLDAFFSTDGQREAQQHGQFPALDFVDLETDEEGQQDLKRDEAGGGGGGEDRSVRPAIDFLISTHHQKEESAGYVKVAEGDVRVDGSPAKLTTSVVGRSAAMAGGPDLGSPPRLTTKDYPLNYQNYKVCRELQPGVEECIILETGEQVICVTKSRASFSEHTVNRPRVVNHNNELSSAHPQEDVERALGELSSHEVMFRRASAEELAYSVDRQEKRHQSVILEKSKDVDAPGDGAPGGMDNIEDDIKLGLQLNTAWKGDEEIGETVSRFKINIDVRSDFVPGGLSERSFLSNSEEEKLKLNIKDLRFDEAPSDDSEVSSENFTPPPEPQQVFGNSNNNNQELPHAEINSSNNADDRLSEEEDYRHQRALNLRYAHPASDRMLPSTYAHSSYESRNHNNYSYDPLGSRSPAKNRHFSERGSSYLDNRGHRLREENSHYRSVDSSLADSSTISSRLTHIERGDHRRDATRPESMTVPRFKTLQDQQVSWLEMFKMIEEQHKCDLQSQYMEHQRIIQDMQRNMEKELIKQQEILKKRLSSHREILQELSPTKGHGRIADEGHNLNQSSKFEDGDAPGEDNRGFNESSSHTTLMGIPVSLRNPAPLNRYLQRDFQDKRNEMESTSRQVDTSLNLSKMSLGGGNKQLRGGVYSSPSPLAKVKHKSSPRGSKSYDDTRHASQREDSVHHRLCDGAPVHRNASCDSSLCESDDVLSPRSRISLREKHAKHLADLKAYYEEELSELKQLLATRQDRAGGDGMTAGEKILSCENQDLRQKCKDLQDVVHDSRIEIRELQQKIQGLEIRASDYAERFDTSQANVLNLKTRLEEVTEFAKEKEAMASEVELKHKKTIEALQMSYKKEKELSEALHNAKVTIQRLVDKYETLEKDNGLNKETLSATEEKLFATRAEAMDASSKLSKLELEVKHLKHDNEVLKHDRAIACSNQVMKTSYEEAYSPMSGFDRSRSAYTSPVKARAKSADRSQFNNVSPESSGDTEFIRSPILRAERELRNLQKSFSTQDFTPKLQKKFYGSELTPRKSGLMSSMNGSTNGHPSPLDPQAKLSFHSRQGKAGNEPVIRTPPRGGSKEMQKGGSRELKVRSGQSAKKSSSHENGITGEQAVDRVKSGEIVSRPAWEDVYTSMAAPARQDSIVGHLAAFNSTREMIIKERIQNIEHLERRYDELSHEKIKYESALNRLPAQGHRGEKDKLESELDRVDRELGSVRMSLKRYHVLKSTI